jgi:8-oxo-dGTP pyrophosphatase MutT (NUDIX family)
MADLSDPPECIDQLVAKLREGNDVVAGSRYMRGGRQIGGPWLKGTLSRLAGTLAYLLTGIGIHDVTTNFRAYSRRLLQSIPIESAGGFELGLELTVKCHLRGWGVAEVPASWHDRSAGQSRFQLFRWLPGYLRWYLRLLTRDPLGLSPSIRQARRSRPRPASYQFFGVYERVDYGWTLQRFRPGTVIVPVTSDGRLVLIRVHRPHHADGQSDWEFPGGGGELGESSLDAGRRELREETGFATNDAGLVLADGLELVPGMGSYPHHVVLFRECKADGGFVPGHGEGIVDVATFSAGEVAELIRTGQIRSLPTVAGFWYFQQYRRPDC